MPQQVRVSREDSVRRSRSLTKSFKGLFKSSSITPPPSSATSGSSASYSANSPKNAPPVSSLAKLALATHHEINACHNDKSDESVISDDSSIRIKSASIASGVLERDHDLSPSPLLHSGHPFANDEDLGTDAEYSSKAQSSRSDHSAEEGVGVNSTEASIDAKLEREVTPSLIYSQNTVRPHRLSTRSRSASAGRRKERCYGTVPHVPRPDDPKKQYIIQQEHFRVGADGHHEHLLKILPLVVQAVDTHKTKSAFSLSAVFKSHKVEDDEMAEALSILPEADKELPRDVNILMKDVMKDVDYIHEKGVHSDENHGHIIQQNTEDIPKIVNEHAAIGRDELKLINNLAERINNGIQKLSKHIPIASTPTPTPTLKAARNRQVLAEKYGKCIGMIGHGSYGTVWVTSKNVPCDHSNNSLVARTYKETFGWNGKLFYAVKELKPRVDESQEKFSTRLTSEFVIGHSLSGQLSQTASTAMESHPNILKVFDLMQTQDSFIEVFEFCPSGDLYSLLTRHSKSGSGLHPLEADCFMKQLLHGVQFMHDHGVAHCDLKPENILFTPVGVLKICDFGSSSVFQTAWEKNVHFQIGAVGSEPYVAPEEFIPRKEYDARLVDCWSCGVIYCTMVLGHYLWKIANRDKDQIYNTFVEDMSETGEYYVFEEMRHVNHEANRCRKMCLYNIFQWNPKKRISIPKLLETPWMRKTKCCVSYQK